MFLGPRPPVSDNGIVVSFIRNVANLNIYAMQPRLHRARMRAIRCIKHVKGSIRGPEVAGGTRSFRHVHDFRVSILNDTSPIRAISSYSRLWYYEQRQCNNKLGIIRRVYLVNFASWWTNDYQLFIFSINIFEKYLRTWNVFYSLPVSIRKL